MKEDFPSLCYILNIPCMYCFSANRYVKHISINKERLAFQSLKESSMNDAFLFSCSLGSCVYMVAHTASPYLHRHYNLSPVPFLITAVNYTVFPGTELIWFALTLRFLCQKTWLENQFSVQFFFFSCYFSLENSSILLHLILEMWHQTLLYKRALSHACIVRPQWKHCHLDSQWGIMEADKQHLYRYLP